MDSIGQSTDRDSSAHRRGLVAVFRTASIFALAGLISGLFSAYAFVELAPGLTERGHQAFAFGLFILPGVLLLIALACCLMLLKKDSLFRCARPWGLLIGSLIVGLNTAFSMQFALLAGFAAASMNSKFPAWQHSASPADLYVFYAFPIVVGLVVGGLTAAVLLAGALYAWTDKWIPKGWDALLISSAIVVALVLAVDPGFLNGLRSSVEAGTSVGELAFSIVFIFGNSFYAACAGYWLFKANCTPLVA